MPSRRRKRRPSIIPFIVVALCAAISAGFMYRSGGLYEFHASGEHAQAMSEARTVIRAQEDRPLPEIYTAPPVEEPEPTAAVEETPVEEYVFDETAEQAAILTMQPGDVTAAQLQRWYRDAALVGDSMAQGARDYGWLTDAVFADIGVRASVNSPQLDRVERRQPAVILLTYGTNDVAVYGGQVEIFITRYSEVIERLKRSCPNSAIYVTAVMPVSDYVAANESYARYIDLYNEELERLCADEEVTFVDAGFILRERPELYAGDGIHLKHEGYPLWLKYLADEASLSRDEDE